MAKHKKKLSIMLDIVQLILKKTYKLLTTLRFFSLFWTVSTIFLHYLSFPTLFYFGTVRPKRIFWIQVVNKPIRNIEEKTLTSEAINNRTFFPNWWYLSTLRHKKNKHAQTWEFRTNKFRGLWFCRIKLLIQWSINVRFDLAIFYSWFCLIFICESGI